VTNAHRITLPRLFALVRFSLLLIVLWLGAALFATSEFYRRMIALAGGHEGLAEVLLLQTSTSMIWATLTPLVIALAERLPLRKPHLVRNGLIIGASLPIIAVIRAALGGVILNLVENDPISYSMVRLSVDIRTPRNVFLGALIVILTNLFLARREAFARVSREREARTLLARAELEELRAQIQPHFLFLTLKTIATVLHEDPTRADTMVVSLADLLRRSLALANTPVPLSDELDFVERYLALYRIVFDDRLEVRFDVDEDVLSARVLPLLVQQLVENAVVHGIAPYGGGELRIRAAHDGTSLILAVSDTAPNASRDDAAALAPVVARMERLFGTRHTVTRGVTGNRYSVTVTIPLEIDADAFAEPDGQSVREAV
jgi:hypothetical protein